jgi:chemotaxis protein MotB
MARKKKHPEHENHERWLVSYADFITLLFAFFVVMFATSQGDKGKAQQVSNSVKEALENDHVAAMVASVLGGSVDNKGQGSAMTKGPGGAANSTHPDPAPKEQVRQQQLVDLAQALSNELTPAIKAGVIQVTMTDRGLVVSFAQAALFPSGEDVISSDAYERIGKVAAAISRMPNHIRLEGHTDAIPINTARFHSNWDLSSARAIALLKILTDRFGVPSGKMSIAGYADTAPVASNDTEEGRARNRRVDIVVLNEQGLKGEPAKLDETNTGP